MDAVTGRGDSTNPDYFMFSERLGFRYWRATDLQLAIRLWGDRDVTGLIGGPFTVDLIRGRLATEIESATEHGVQYWPLFLIVSGSFIGCCGLRPYRLNEGVYELGVHLLSKYWGQGLAHEASQIVIQYAFDEIGAAGLFAGHHPDNLASRRLLARLGFRFTHRELYTPTGREHPSYMLTTADYAAIIRDGQTNNQELS